MSDGITDAYTGDRWRDAKAANPGLDPRVNLISRQDNGKWMAMESGVGTFAIHAEADNLAELIAGPDAITLSIEHYGALVREREQAIRDYERVRDALELAKQGDAGAIAKAAKREALAAVLALYTEYGVDTYADLIEAEMAKL